jgi:hypothetical protein
MKLNELKKVIKQSVKEAIQEEMKDILLEAIKSSKQPIVENRTDAPVNYAPTATAETPKFDRAQVRENYMNVLGDMAAGKTVNTSNIGKPLQVTSADTTSPNGSLPEGEVGMGQIMDLMKGKV